MPRTRLRSAWAEALSDAPTWRTWLCVPIVLAMAVGFALLGCRGHTPDE